MQLLALLPLAAVALAAPAPQLGLPKAAAGAYDLPGACTFSVFEKANLGHNHDVNTGKIKYSDSNISSMAPKLGGSGCSPAWAVGGKPNDNTPTKTPGASGGLFSGLFGGLF